MGIGADDVERWESMDLDGIEADGPYLVHERACYYSGARFTDVPPTDDMCICPDPQSVQMHDFNEYFFRTISRHTRRQPVTTDSRTITDLARSANETPVMGRASKFPAARETVAAAIAQALGASETVKKTWTLNGVTGPMGGVSEQVHGIIDLDGDLMPFVVSVYSDAAIDKKVVARLEEAKRDAEVNQSLASLLEP